ncbi:Pantothenate transporter FEN2 [Vanrija pseudolonga]|uniref:Pantothenate transporter FEN2 n=1 Tax=Vanrija pseudolonga TaxID=143232 RepID=A0AAF0YG78_9TREE|nr:Pantothenate transporter FEN2 [Vanrija pseudolonga]
MSKSDIAESMAKRIKGWVLLNNPSWTDNELHEKRLVRKLDIFFASYLAVSSVVKYLDQTNIGNAYAVSGMQGDLELFGNQYNFFTTYFNIGYIIMIPISNFVINSVVRPSIWLPTLEIVWGILTGCLAAVHHYKAVCRYPVPFVAESLPDGLRFLIGFFEGCASSTNAVAMVLLLSWYLPTEVGKRIAVYNCAASIGGIFSGALQSALYRNLNGVGGLEGWRWLFVMNAIITVTVGLWGFLAIPDYPDRISPLVRRLWLNEQDEATALRRVGREGPRTPVGWKWNTLTSLVKRKELWAIYLAYTVLGQGQSGYVYFNLWLKSLLNPDGTKRYSVYQLNYIPMAGNGTMVVSLAISMILSDHFGTQWPISK